MKLSEHSSQVLKFILILIFAVFVLGLELSNLTNKYNDIIAEQNIIAEKHQEELDAVNNELNEANVVIADLKTDECEFVYIGEYKITHYCNEEYKHICGYGNRTTATGTKTEVGRTVAVDPEVIPYGTQMYIEGYGWRVAEDCGGSVKGNHIDVLVEYHDEAMKMGAPTKGAWILVHKNPLR